MATWRDLPFHPNPFFERISKEPVNFLPPLAIVGAGLAISLLPFIIALFYALFIGSHSIMYVGWMGYLQFFIKCDAIIPLLTWGVMAFGSWGISCILKGNGSLALTIQNTGYGMMPWAIFIAFFTVFSGIIILARYLTPLPPGFLEMTATNGYAVLPFVNLVVVLWQWCLWISATRFTHGFTVQKAMAVTLIPVAVVIAMTIPLIAWTETGLTTIAGWSSLASS